MLDKPTEPTCVILGSEIKGLMNTTSIAVDVCIQIWSNLLQAQTALNIRATT